MLEKVTVFSFSSEYLLFFLVTQDSKLHTSGFWTALEDKTKNLKTSHWDLVNCNEHFSQFLDIL